MFLSFQLFEIFPVPLPEVWLAYCFYRIRFHCESLCLVQHTISLIDCLVEHEFAHPVSSEFRDIVLLIFGAVDR